LGRKNKLDTSLDLISNFFDNYFARSFTENKFRIIFESCRYEWGIPANRYSSHVLRYLINKKLMLESTFRSERKEKSIYTWKSTDEFTIISGLKSNSYFSHYSAMRIHQLSLQIPKTIYLNSERNPSTYNSNTTLTQDSIDQAFKTSQRKSLDTLTYSENKILMVNGKFTNKLGVIKIQNAQQCFEYTDLERTLLDISVRPAYAGGVFEVLEAYKLAKNNLNITKLAAYLHRLDFIYPYHQVVGFYLTKAGYSRSEIDLFRKEMKFNFYLTYEIRNKEFSHEWRLFYPKGF
jgi:hypothetical protein